MHVRQMLDKCRIVAHANYSVQNSRWLTNLFLNDVKSFTMISDNILASNTINVGVLPVKTLQSSELNKVIIINVLI